MRSHVPKAHGLWPSALVASPGDPVMGRRTGHWGKNHPQTEFLGALASVSLYGVPQPRVQHRSFCVVTIKNNFKDSKKQGEP